jgi:hypothetical protein
LYAKPGLIENESLLISGNYFLLKPNLMEHHDYVALPQSVWQRVFAWYSSDWSIVRLLKKDIYSNGELFLDLYPSQYDVKELDLEQCEMTTE